MKKIGFVSVVVLVLFFVVQYVPAGAVTEEVTAGKEILAKWQKAVVMVQLVSKQRMSFGGRESSGDESKSEAIGTVIDPSGLVVMSLFATDPSARFNELFGGGGEEESRFKMQSEITDVKILLPDGTELPAKIVLRDKDLDLAFVRPINKLAKPLPALDLTQSKPLQTLDSVIILSRLGKVANRVPAVSIDMIQAVVEKPRTFFIPGGKSEGGDFGAPAFALNGKVAGIILLRSIPMDRSGRALFGGMSGLGMLPVILPASDILEVVKQVPATVPAEEKKAEEKKPAEKPAPQESAPVPKN
ncbi:MAG: serine protease [bacterium]|nr:serine protease [bacterium]